MVTLTGTLLQPRSQDQCDILPGATVRIGDDGRIAEAGSAASPGGEAIGGDGCWILPGFVDAHVHLPQWDCRGIDGLTLFDWQEKVVHPAEMRFRDADFAERLADDCGLRQPVSRSHRPCVRRL